MTVAALSTHIILITDENNPLIERKYPTDMVEGDNIELPHIYYFNFTQIPDFSQTVMQSAPTYANSKHLNHSAEANVTAQPSMTMPVSPNVKSANTSLDSKSLSSRQVIAQAAAQAKAIQQQKQLAEEQRHAQEVARYNAAVEAALLSPTLHEGLRNQRHSIVDAQSVVKTATIFGELSQDLQTIDLPEADISAQTGQIYKKAVTVIQAVESGNTSQLENLSKAMQVIESFAENGVADALLRKALWLFEGNRALNIGQNEQEALALLQLAGKQADSRAEKLLSKLYYAGHLVEQDNDMGKFWLDLAADHGHPEAIRISQDIATISLLKQTQREDNRYAKKMGLAIVALITVMILIFVGVKI